MQQSITDIFFALLRYSLEDVSSRGEARDLPITEPLSDDDWKRIFVVSKKQALIGIIYSAVQRLPQDLQPPKELMDKWNQNVRQIIIRNTRMNATAAQLTQMFEEKGRKTVILKGQANALLYPDPYLRQAGDIDILLEGGRSSVINLLNEMNLVEKKDISEIHAHIDEKKMGGVSVEVHFAPGYNASPISSRFMQNFLQGELKKENAAKKTPEGFYAPPVAYALIMQLSHIFRHFYNEGIGFRQLVDYRQLLQNCSNQDKQLVLNNLKKCGLFNIASGIMWIMENQLGLKKEKLLCPPNEWRGKYLLQTILEGGNFGKYSKLASSSVIKRWIGERKLIVKRFGFDITEGIWFEIRYLLTFIKCMPARIKYRRMSVRSIH